ncbi:MAG: hypothetical protein ASARMPREDX12_006195 [Alectoria sarmentosa]|nr:MAG: hypothetical protein ASARMPREDX12_006195 [Alectoria sarmentosa]
MPALLSLPNEILDYIVNYIHIDDIEAFSSCCRPIKLVAAVRLQRHLERKFKYPTIMIVDKREDTIADYMSEDTWSDPVPTYLLRDFLMDEENTLYPRFMSIGGSDTTYRGSEEIRSALATTSIEEHQGLEDKLVAKVMQIQTSLYTEEPIIEAQDWIDRIKKGNFSATAALLVTLFPNVKTLSMFNQDQHGTETLLIRTLEKLTSAAAKSVPGRLGAFSELSGIELEGPTRRGAAYGQLIAMFMIMPTMRVVKGRRVHWSAFDWPYGSITSRVKDVSLDRSEIHSKSLINCLKRIEALEKFTYDLVPTRSPSLMIWEPRLIVKALRKHARRTLVHLELTGEASCLSSGLRDGEPFIGTLRSFQVLESVRLMTMMLFKQIDGEDIDESEKIMEERIDGEAIDDNDEVKKESENFGNPNSLMEPRRLTDFLPPSARKLELVGGLSDEEARDMFTDLPKLKCERLPNLCEIVLEDSDPLEQETKNLCREAGIRLKSIKRVVNGYQRIYTITKPAPQEDDLEC